MKHAHVSASVLLLLAIPTAFAGHFRDVTTDHPAYNAIEFFVSKDVVEGYTVNGTKVFKPDQLVNRAEAVKLLLAGSSKEHVIPSSVTSSYFTDVPRTEWYAPYVAFAYALGIVAGDNNQRVFSGGRTVNRAELLKMLIMANDIDLDKKLQGISTQLPSDVKSTDWYAPFFRYAKEYGILTPDESGRMLPGKNLTRHEVVTIMYRTLMNVYGGEPQELLSRTEAKMFEALVFLNANNLTKALDCAKEATIHATKAKNLAPNSTVANDALDITLAFEDIVRAKQAKANGTSMDAFKKSSAEHLANVTTMLHLKERFTTILDSI